MKKGYVEENVKMYFSLMENVANELLKKLKNKMAFQAKLERVKVSIVETKGMSLGECLTEREDRLFINLEVKPKDRVELIEVVMAHELTHLLLSVFYRLADYCITDGSFPVSSVVRNCDGEVYGDQLEEVLCDYIAIDVVYSLHNGKITRDEISKILYEDNEFCRFTSKNIEVMKEIIDIFSYDNKIENEFYDSVVEIEEDIVCPKNSFLYYVCGGQLGPFINEYDEKMGKGAWKRFNKLLDEFFEDNSKKEILIKVHRELDILKEIFS